MVDFEVYRNTLANRETSPYDCNSFNDSRKHLSNYCEYGTCNRIIEANIGLKEMKSYLTNKLILGYRIFLNRSHPQIQAAV